MVVSLLVIFQKSTEIQLASEGNFWQRQRRLVQPAFHQERIAAYADVMVAYTNQLLDRWQDGSIRDIHQDMMSLTAQIVSKTLFNVDIACVVEGVQAALNAGRGFYCHSIDR